MVVLTYADPSKGVLNVYSRQDIEKVLRFQRLSSQPFEPFFPAVTQLAQRRNRIVHEADLDDQATLVDDWTVADEWRLMCWTVAVPAFFVTLQSLLNPSDAELQSRRKGYVTAMNGVRDLGWSLVEFSSGDSTDVAALQAGAQRVSLAARNVISTLQPPR